MKITDMVLALGRGLIKVFTSVVGGVGTGLVTAGYFALQEPSVWDLRHEPPPGEIFFSIGAGLLAGAILMVAQFQAPWAYRNCTATPT